MQKLKFINGNGVEIDLTDKVNFGIIAWEGFSADGLNIQSQQVPFQDGGVFLDALMEQRELSVTVAINAKGDLDKRYRLRRELISVLNPKLGEGILIYSDNYLSKQIHVIPQIPLFDTNNSNDSGTPKVSCGFTACNPYWEDLEETIINFGIEKQPVIENNGDVPCSLIINLLSSGVNTPTITNVSTEKKIQLKGSFSEEITINTGTGKKSVFTSQYKEIISGVYSNLKRFFYDSINQRLYLLGTSGFVLYTKDFINFNNWEYIKTPVYTSNDAIYDEARGKYIVLGETGIYVGDNFDSLVMVAQTPYPLYKIAYSNILNLYCAVGYKGYIYTSANLTDWNRQIANVDVSLMSVIYDEDKEIFIAVGGTKILTSQNGIDWAVFDCEVSKASLQDIAIKNGLICIIGFHISVTSNNGTSWTITSLPNVNYCYVIKVINEKFVIFPDGYIASSEDGVNWELENVTERSSVKDFITMETSGMSVIISDYNRLSISSDLFGEYLYNNFYLPQAITEMCYCAKDKIFYGICTFIGVTNGIKSNDGKRWELFNLGIGRQFYTICYSEKLNIYILGEYNNKIAIFRNGLENAIGEEITIGNDLRIKSITYSEERELFVLIGNNSLYTSENGLTWTLRQTYEEGINQVIYSPIIHKFIVDGNILSSDGINWEKNENYTQGVVFSSTKIFFKGFDDGVKISYDYEQWSDLQSLGIPQAYSPDKDLYVFGGNVVGYLQKNYTENVINKISADSDINMQLQIGENRLRLTRLSGYLECSISFRKKYIGV